MLPWPIQRCHVADDVEGSLLKNMVQFKSDAFTDSTTMIVPGSYQLFLFGTLSIDKNEEIRYHNNLTLNAFNYIFQICIISVDWCWCSN